MAGRCDGDLRQSSGVWGGAAIGGRAGGMTGGYSEVVHPSALHKNHNLHTSNEISVVTSWIT